MTKLLELMATRIGESLGGDGDGIGLVLGRISECVDMVLPPLSMEMEEGVGLDVPGRRMKELINTYSDEDDGPMNLMTSGKWANLICALVCITCAATAAGLTMGFVSIDPLEIAIKQRSGTPEERKQASKLLPLITRHHYLLVSLLLFNALAAEALPIFLDKLVPAVAAVILSVTAILLFGEIIPSAIFTGPHQYFIASKLSPIVYFLMFVFGPIAWPIGKILDFFLGHEGYKRYNRAEISALMELQRGIQQDVKECSADELSTDPLHEDEVAIVSGVLQTYEKSVKDAMIPLDRVYCLSMDTKLDKNTMADIMAAGYSRVPVYDGETENIRGYLQVKRLIILSPDDERVIRSIYLRLPQVVSPNDSLLDLLNVFQTGHAHVALVSNSPLLTTASLRKGMKLEGKIAPIGIITLEDIFEEIIQEEIYDESDNLARDIEARARATLVKYARRRKTFKRIVGHRLKMIVASSSQSLETLKPASSQYSLITRNERMADNGKSFGSSSSLKQLQHPSELKKSRALLAHIYVEHNRSNRTIDVRVDEEEASTPTQNRQLADKGGVLNTDSGGIFLKKFLRLFYQPKKPSTDDDLTTQPLIDSELPQYTGDGIGDSIITLQQ